MTKVDLRRVLDLDQQATPGPWLAHDNGTGWILQTSPAKHLNSLPEAQFKERDAQLTSYYRNNAPAMAKALNSVLGAIEVLRKDNPREPVLLNALGILEGFIEKHLGEQP